MSSRRITEAADPLIAELLVPEPDLEPGALVGEYVVVGKLGEGGFGAVF